MKRPESPEEILIWMDETIQYGWLDGEKKVHRDMTGFRRDYRIASFEECLKYRVGTCIEQVWMMHLLLDQLYLPNKMYCCRIFEPDDYGNLEEEEHMHCFVLYWKDGKVWLSGPLRITILHFGAVKKAPPRNLPWWSRD